MPIPLYLAMTAAEFSRCDPLPDKIGWMACHFSPYGTGLSNCPHSLPQGSLLILNDRTPVCGHDPKTVSGQLCRLAEQFQCSGILLDLQRPGCPETAKIVEAIRTDAPCPVAVTEYYITKDCAVFLSPPLHIPLAEFLAPWQGREIWLEAAIEDTCFTVTRDGCTQSPLFCPPPDFPHRNDDAYCRYHIATDQDAVRFSLHRGQDEVQELLKNATGAARFVGLFQQWKLCEF